MKIVHDTLHKFLALNKIDREGETASTDPEDPKERSLHFRRKSSAPIIRSTSHKGDLASFGSAEIPRVLIEGDGGFGKSSLLVYARDLARHQNLAIS